MHRCRHTPFLMESMTYKELIADLIPNNTAGASISKLPVRDWAPLVSSVQYQAFKGDTFKWFVESGINGWNTYVQFDDFWDQVHDLSINATEAARLLIWAGNLKLHCNCPSYLFHGYQYIDTQLDCALVPEERYPVKNNPELLGWGCKHLRRTMKVLPFNQGKIASAVKMARAGIDQTPGLTDDD